LRNLFAKIFVWFCVTLFAGVLASLLATGILMEHGVFETLSAQVSKAGLALAGVTAAQIYEDQGKPSLQDYFNRVQDTGGGRLFLVDETDREVNGHALSGTALALLPRARAENGVVAAHTRQTTIRALAIKGPKGSSYVLLRETRRPLPRSWPRIFIHLLALLVTGGVLCYVLARHLSTPLRVLQNAARRLAEGDLNVRVAPELGARKDEIGQLAVDFDSMAARLQDLLDSHQRLLRDISHELRSPLTRLRVALELARQRSGPQAEDAIHRIEKESDRLNSLIAQLLTLARLERGLDGESREVVDLRELLEDVVADANFEAGSETCTEHYEDSVPLFVEGHPELLRSAIENVIRNAVRHTLEGSRVEVTLSMDPSAKDATAVIRIRDHGPGIPEEELSKVFRPFYRTSEARDRHTGGAGLGLAIAWRAVQVHAGSITAQNASGGGLLVQIRLPLKIPRR
jgi:two-component system, OmpR family, sensor histidine kinase CpxA